ncbi:hypothetical protein A2U01_0010676, partial [Trifolium medium]|nr:hypothetical protein [Trifolium medium]
MYLTKSWTKHLSVGNLRTPKILEINLMAPTKRTDSNWPPLLDEKLLEVFIAAQQEGGNSRSSQYWNGAVIQVNRHIEENFSQLPHRDIASLRERLKCLRRSTA